MVTLAQLKTYCRVSGTEEDDLLTAFQATAKRQFNKVLGKALSNFDDSLPDNASVDLAMKYQVLSYYENRSFLKPDAENAVSQMVLNLLAADRDVSAFIPDPDDENESLPSLASGQSFLVIQE